MSPAINAWTGATINRIEPVPGVDGRGVHRLQSDEPICGVWHYEYAIYNQNLDRAIQSFSVPLGAGITVSNLGFHAPPNHPGIANDGTVGSAGFSNAAWTSNQTASALSWSSETFAQNQNANAIRWGTLYNFRFDSNQSAAGYECDDRLLQDGNANHRWNPGPRLGCRRQLRPQRQTQTQRRPDANANADADSDPNARPRRRRLHLPSPTARHAPGSLSQNFDRCDSGPARGLGGDNRPRSAPLWVTSTTTPDTAPNAATIDDPATVSDKRLDTPCLTVSSALAQVTFRHSYNLETSSGPFFDGGVLEVSSPNIKGEAFTDITDAAVGVVLPVAAITATIRTFRQPDFGPKCVEWQFGGYITTVANLGPNVNGQTIKLRFRMASDTSVTGTGWRVDTITSVAVCVVPNAQTPTPTPTPGPPTPTPGPCGTAFSENFDGVTAPALPAGWAASNSAGTTLWVTSSSGTPAPAFDSSPNAAFIIDPTTVSDRRLDTRSLTVSSTGAQVSFRNNYNLESTFDGGVLEVSSPNINGGAFTDITDAAVGGSFVTGGYNAMIVPPTVRLRVERRGLAIRGATSPPWRTSDRTSTDKRSSCVFTWRLTPALAVPGGALDTITSVGCAWPQPERQRQPQRQLRRQRQSRRRAGPSRTRRPSPSLIPQVRLRWRRPILRTLRFQV